MESMRGIKQKGRKNDEHKKGGYPPDRFYRRWFGRVAELLLDKLFVIKIIVRQT